MEIEDIKSRGSVISLCYSDKPDAAKQFSDRVRFVKEEPGAAQFPTEQWHEQIEILSWDTVSKLMEKDYKYEFGECGDQLCITSANLSEVAVDDVLFIGRSVLRVVRIGMDCRNQCKIGFFHPDDCPASGKWIFAKIVKEGPVCVEDDFLVMGAQTKF